MLAAAGSCTWAAFSPRGRSPSPAVRWKTSAAAGGSPQGEAMAREATITGPLWPRRLSAVLGLYALLGGAISFGGWALDIPRLTDWVDNDVSIQPNAAVLITLAGAAVLLLRFGRRRAAVAIGGLVTLAGGLTLLQYVVGADFGFNHQLLFGRAWGQGTTLTPGRVGPPASTSFVLIGTALVVLGLRGPRVGRARRLVP